MSFVHDIRSSIIQGALVSRGGHILLGVSGGADSMSLLHAFTELRHELGIQLTVAHFNHGLRRSAGRDERFVRAACKKLGIACIVGKNTRKPPRTGSLEDFARNLRQTFFVKTAQLIKADAVALAHTRDDLAETVLMRLLRGTGLDGLRAILPRRRIRSVIFIRPLLSVTRRQVESFLKGMKVPFVTDPTNASRDIHRNLIRLKVIPALEKMTREDLKARLASLAQTAGVDYDLIEQMALSLLKKRFSLSKGLNTRGWPEIHPALRRMVLRLAYETAAREHEPLPLNHIDALDRMILIARDSRLSLANDRQAVLCKGSLKFF